MIDMDLDGAFIELSAWLDTTTVGEATIRFFIAVVVFVWIVKLVT